MQPIDVLIEADTDLDWSLDPTDLERALARRADLETTDDRAGAVPFRLTRLKLAQELGRVVQH
jgi:hypothetical protein